MPSRNEVFSLLRKLLEEHADADPTWQVGMDKYGAVVMRTGPQVWTFLVEEVDFIGDDPDRLAADHMKALPYPPR